jgi:hypothetical protein
MEEVIAHHLVLGSTAVEGIKSMKIARNGHLWFEKKKKKTASVNPVVLTLNFCISMSQSEQSWGRRELELSWGPHS